MDLARLAGSMFFLIAPVLISFIARQIRRKPVLQNPIKQYLIVYVVMSLLNATSLSEDKFALWLFMTVIYIFFFIIDYLAYRRYDE